MSRSNAPQVLSVVSRRSTGHSYYVDESNPWPGDFESDNEEREYVNTEDLPGEFENELEYVNPNGMPGVVDTDQEDYVIPVDLVSEDLYETVDELRQGKSMQYNRCKKETHKHRHPDVKIVTESDLLLQDSTRLSIFEIHQAGIPPEASLPDQCEQEPIYTNMVDNVSEEFPPPPPIRESRTPPPIPPVPAGPRASPPPPRPQESPSLPIIQTTSIVPSPSEITSDPIIQRPSLPSMSPDTIRLPTMADASSSDQKYSEPESTSKRSPSEIRSQPVIFSPSIPPTSPGTSRMVTTVGTSQSDEKCSEPGSTSKPTPPTCLLERRPKGMGLESQVWYAGDCSKEEADELLRNSTEDGSFLVRKSQRSGQPYTLCVVHQGGIRRFPVRHRKEDGHFALGTPKPDEIVFSSVEEIITFYRNNPIEYGKERSKVTLTKAATE